MNEVGKRRVKLRKRSWYRRRLRVQRTFLTLGFIVVLGFACWQNAARILSWPSLRPSQALPGSFWAKADMYRGVAFPARPAPKAAKVVERIPGIYPYSVVPGGVKDVDELRYAAARDPVVRRHYSRFDFKHAKLVRVSEPREVFVSYRIRETVFWTRKRIRLHAGELLLTDGKITARAKCGNQVSDTAKPEVSEDEPEEDVMDEPAVAVADSPLLPPRPMLAAHELPAGQPAPPPPIAGPFLFPYVSMGLPMPRFCTAEQMLKDGHCVPKRHRKPIVPEPPTFYLIATGIVLTAWRYRRAATSLSR